MKRLADTRCFNHYTRESAARCPSCGRHYCRECVTEHEGRLLCASCLAGPEVDPERRKRMMQGIGATAQMLFAVLCFWAVFSIAGGALLKVPAAFHEAPSLLW